MQALTSHFWKEKDSILQNFCLTTSFLTHFYLWCKLYLKNWRFSFFWGNQKIFVFSNLFSDEKAGIYWNLMDIKRDILVLKTKMFLKKILLLNSPSCCEQSWNMVKHVCINVNHSIIWWLTIWKPCHRHDITMEYCSIVRLNETSCRLWYHLITWYHGPTWHHLYMCKHG